MLSRELRGMDNNEIDETYKALSLHGWKVAASHAAAGSKVAIDEISEFASFPVRPLFTLTDVVSICLCTQSRR